MHCGYPRGRRARCSSSSSTGRAPRSRRSSTEVERHCRDNGAFEIRIAADDAERALFWKGRKSAFAAVGRISPDYIVQDGVIPRTALPEVLRRIAELSRAAPGVRVANVFHAGDGNLHPLVLFDDAVPGEAEHAEEVSGAILDLCIEHGGSITGEHGVGMDKAKYMPRMFTDDDLDTMQMLRCAFDPAAPVQPGQGLPDPAALRRGARPAQGRRTRCSRPGWRRCSERADGRPGARDDLSEGRATTRRGPRGADGRRRRRPAALRRGARRRPSEVAEVLRVAAQHDLRVVARGAGTKLDWGAPADARRPGRSTRPRLTGVVEHAAGDLVVARPRRHADRRAAGGRSPRPASSSRWTTPLPGATVGGTLADQHQRAAAAALRHAARPADRRHLRARRRRRRQGRRQGRQERRGLRLRQAAHRLLRHARRHHRGRVPAAPAAGRPPRRHRDRDVRRRRGRRAPRSPSLGSQVVPSAVELDAPGTTAGARSTVLVEGVEAGVARARPTARAALLGRRRDRAATEPAGLVRALPVRRRRHRAQGHLRRHRGRRPVLDARAPAGGRARRRARASRGSAAGVLYAGLPGDDRPAGRRRRVVTTAGTRRRRTAGASPC